jgi:hypothetical protein
MKAIRKPYEKPTISRRELLPLVAASLTDA